MSEVDRRDEIQPRSPAIFFTLVAIAAAAIGFGAYAFYRQTAGDFIVTHLRTPGFGGAAWGLYICFDVYFVGVSFAGITVAAIARLFHVDTLKPITRLAELLTISSLIAGGCVIVADLGRPLHGLLKLPAYARPSSPFYGTFTLVIAGYMFSSFVYFVLAGRRDAAAMARTGPRLLRWLYRLWASGYRDTPIERRRHRKTSFWLSLTILPLLVVAHSTLGFIFGIQSGRPGWYSALQAPAFVVLAGVSGTGMVILAAVTLRKLFGLHRLMPDAALRWLGTFLWILALIYVYFMVVEELTASYAAPAADRHVAHQVVAGEFALSFWITAISLFLAFLIPFLMFVTKRFHVAGLVVAAALANVAAILKRLLIVVPSQTEGALLPIEPARSYTPNWIEIGIITGLFGIIALALLVFTRLFPIVPSKAADEPETPSPRQLRRGLATGLTAAIAIAMIAFGLIDSFRLLSGGELDPVVRFSPVIFASGVMVLFSSAIVYEVIGDARAPDPPSSTAD
jgi:molybdopterin-containing oxidoreductase family membrane subunit